MAAEDHHDKRAAKDLLEVDAERESGVALKAQVGVLSKCLEDAKSI